MATLTVDKFVELVRKSGLVDEDQLNSVREELTHSDGDEGSDQLAQALVDRKLLTQWQSERLLEGRHRGFILGKYKLLGLLGTGGMSSVYLAEHMLMQRHVAIKVLPRQKVDDTSYLARFRREAQAVAALDHRNIVRAYDIDNDGNTHYLVMEYVQGRDLNTIVKNDGPLDYDTAADYIRQAAEGLQHAHDAGLIHRDIKPANLLVDRRGIVKILDMGLARFIDEEQSSLTRVHDENVLGTADYLSPEQAKDSHTADHRADIYSLGCTLYFLLTGHPPFAQGSLAERIAKHQSEAPPSIFAERADAPKPLVEVCMRMMAKQPDARVQTAGEVARQLASWLAARGRPTDSPVATARARPAPLPRRTAVEPPVRRQTDSPEDTVSDKTRITMKGRPAGATPPPPKPGSSVRRAAVPGAQPNQKPPSNIRSAAGANAPKPGDSRVNKSPSSKKLSALPVAKPIPDPPAAKPVSPPDPLAAAMESLSLSEQASQYLAPTVTTKSPQWMWWSVVGGAVLLVVILLIIILTQLL
jgi:serine/threonine-protein kinase